MVTGLAQTFFCVFHLLHVVIVLKLFGGSSLFENNFGIGITFGLDPILTLIFHYLKPKLLFFSFVAGVQWTISNLSEAPTKATEYTSQGLQYLKDLTK